MDTLAADNKMDIFDVAKKVFGIKKTRSDTLPLKHPSGPFFTAIPYPTYAIVTGFAGALPANISFYTSKKEHGELSFFNNMFEYTQYKQTIYFTLSNLFFHHDQWELVGDWRYYNFPTNTYGLGTATLPSEIDPIDYSHLRFYELVMRQILPHFDVGAGYHLDYHWDIQDNGNDAGQPTGFQAYGYTKTSLSSGISVDLLYDSRNIVNNPNEGTYFNLQFRTFDKPFGSNSNWNSMIIEARKYVLLTKKWRTELAFWGYAWLTLDGHPPYLDLPSIGWDYYNNTGRGYAAGRYRGLDMLYFETEFRFLIMRNGFLGGVVFFNLETFTEYPYTYFGSFQPGVGLGLRVKINKKTNSNSALDYGFGTHHSQGFAFNLNEVY